MTAETIFIAKDGRRFEDPLLCDAYEKTIGLQDDTIGGLLARMETWTATHYITGTLLIWNGESMKVYTVNNILLDDLLEDYVNPELLPEEKRWVSATVNTLKKALRHMDKDWLCNYMFNISPNRDGTMGHVTAVNSQRLWNESNKNTQ